MTSPTIKHGLFGAFRRGEHFVMPQREPDNSTVYGVWLLTNRQRNFEGTAVKVAEFRSKREANAWRDKRNMDTCGTRAMR